MIADADARLVPNVALRSLLIDYEEGKTLEWEATERRWREVQQQQQGTEEQGKEMGGS
jgi:hypothetical protein